MSLRILLSLPLHPTPSHPYAGITVSNSLTMRLYLHRGWGLELRSLYLIRRALYRLNHLPGLRKPHFKRQAILIPLHTPAFPSKRSCLSVHHHRFAQQCIQVHNQLGAVRTLSRGLEWAHCSTEQRVTIDVRVELCALLVSLTELFLGGKQSTQHSLSQLTLENGLNVMVSHIHQNQVKQTETSEGCKFLGISHGFREMKICYKSFHSLGNLGTWLFLEQ